MVERARDSHPNCTSPSLFICVFAVPRSNMKASLGLLAGLTACILAENCDPIAYEQSNPYGLSETKDPEVMKNLNKYLEDSRCHMLSDESEQNVEEQKKNLKTLEPTSTSSHPLCKFLSQCSLQVCLDYSCITWVYSSVRCGQDV
jgi:hypothetical protein